MRALRLSLDKPELFLPQLRAILRAAAGYPCRIMFPMVAELAEIEAARTWLEKAHQQLSSESIEHAWPAEVGIMVEIPSAALLSETLVKAVDFFSIGTNDLTQYTLAAERGNPALAYLADGLNPAVLKLIGQVCGNAHQAGKWVGICGELGGDPIAIPVLVGLGVDELSMSAPAIPRAKDIIRALKLSDAQVLAQKALQAASSKAVRALVKNAQA
jgi:phosphoenolpyruvate-protein kinase (PTS system EI component)